MGVNYWIYFIAGAFAVTKTSSSPTDCLVSFSQDCFIDVKCTQRIYFNIYNDYYSRSSCLNLLYYNGVYYKPIHLSYRNFDNTNNLINWNNINYELKNMIVTFDLSNNQLQSQPALGIMENLKVLNLSYNNLTVAKLSDRQLYNKLTEVDFSYNAIKDIKVYSSENIYNELEKLDLSNNILDNIPETVFDFLSKLEHLNLSNNHLTSLNLLSFIGLKNLQNLQLAYNQIVDIESSLFRLKNLRKLSFKHNRIERIFNRNFQNLVNLQKLDLSSNRIVDIEKKSFDNMTYLIQLDLSENALNDIDNEIFKYTFNLNSIDLSVNKLKHLPKELFKEKNISYFSIENNMLEGKLVNGMFLGLNNITRIDISNQYLTSVEDYAFTGLDKLESLLLNNNKIVNLSIKSFETLIKVTLLDLSDNYIFNIDFEKNHLTNLRSLSLKNNLLTVIKNDTFNFLNQLNILDLSYNNISSIDNNSFKELKTLTSLYIANNPLEGLGSETFSGLVSLPDLDISKSRITILKNNTFKDMEELKYLNMSHSSIADIQFNCFFRSFKMETIDLSFNKLINFALNTTDLINLNILLLNNNLITAISSSSLINLFNLKRLFFSHNNLNTIHNEAFIDEKSLIFLDLSYNPTLIFNFTLLSFLSKLQSVKLTGTSTDVSLIHVNDTQLIDLDISHAHIKNLTNRSFDNFTHLEKLVLTYNEISTVNKDSLIKLNNLQFLDLSSNQLKFLQPGTFKNNYNLKLLNISHNSLIDLNYGTLRGLVSLDILDLSFNYIENLEKDIFSETESLKSLIVDNNRIKSLNSYELIDLHISKLSIGDNPIPCKQIVQLKKKVSFDVTSLRYDEHRENVKGVTCNERNPTIEDHHPSQENNDSKRIYDVLKEIFTNSSRSDSINERSKVDNQKYIANISNSIRKSNDDVIQQLQRINNAVLYTSADSNKTYALLERILKVLISTNQPDRQSKTMPRENVTFDNLSSYINQIKQNLENEMFIQKETILSELDNKISLAMSRNRNNQDDFLANEKKSLQSNIKFIEICVGLVLAITIGVLIYKSIKWCKSNSRLTWQSDSQSRRQIVESLENSSL